MGSPAAFAKPALFSRFAAPQFKGMSSRDYLEAAFASAARPALRKIYDQIIKDYFRSEDRVLDYGCGPGFLAVVVSKRVNKIYAFDISDGHSSLCTSLEYERRIFNILSADDAGLSADRQTASLDVVFSFAMIQHLSDEILERRSRKLAGEN